MRLDYSDEFIAELADYVGDGDLEIELHTKTEWTVPLFGAFKPYLDLSGRRMLDAGCGHGVAALVAHTEGMTVEAFDISDRAAGLTNQRLRAAGCDTVAFTHDIRTSIPDGFAGAFDLVTSHQVLEHIPRAQQFKAIRNLCAMVKPGGILYINTENSLYPFDQHDTLLPLIRLLAPQFQTALVQKLGKSLNYYETSFESEIDLHDYISYDELIGAAAVLGLDPVNTALPYGTERERLFALTGGYWLYDQVARYFDVQRFLPISVLLRKAAD